MPPATTAQLQRIRVWDAPIRIFHWLLVLLVAISWWTAETGRLEYHRYAGYTAFGLLLFRIYWGFVGSSTARFASFLKPPATVLSYLRGIASRGADATHSNKVLGHNPAGGWSVLLMLVLLSLQVGLGLVSVDIDGLESGPLSQLVSFDTGRACAKLHATVFDVLLAVIVLHVAAVLFYLWYKRENLVSPMITGTRLDLGSGEVTSVSQSTLLRTLLGVLFAGLAVWLIVGGVLF